ncbi:MAG: hypothetical protein AAB451_02680 [Patescibacteria group bacterium]
MYNWNVNEKELKKDKEKYAVWKLEQMVNFGLNGEKINSSNLKKFWDKLRLDPARKRFLQLLLYGK